MTRKATGRGPHVTTSEKLACPASEHVPPQTCWAISIEEKPREKMRLRAVDVL
jgi:hypothetical protein